MKVRYIGDATDAREPFAGPAVIQQDGFTFVKGGDAVDIPDDHERADKYRNNHTFFVAGDDRPKAPVDEEREAETFRQELEERGVEPPKKARSSRLRQMVQREVDNEPAPAGDAPPPVPAS